MKAAQVFAGRVVLAASVFLLGLFAMGATFDVIRSSPSVLFLMQGFVSAPFEMLIPLFLSGYILLSALGVSIAWGRRRLSVLFFSLFSFNFWWAFYSHALFDPGNLYWFPTQYLSGWSFGLYWDVETLYVFLLGVGLFAASRLISGAGVVRTAMGSLEIGAVALMAFMGALLLVDPHWFFVQVANYEQDVFGLNLNFLSNGLLFYASAAVALAAELSSPRWRLEPARP